MHHSFDVDIAQKYGILEAVLLNNIEFWIKKNEANGENFHDGCYWTYNSVKAFGDLFPYASPKQIRNALTHLIEEGLLQTGHFNELPYDRTLWYSFTDKGISIIQGKKIDLPCGENEFAQEGEPIPDINTDINTDINNTPYIIPPKGNPEPKKQKKKKGILSPEEVMEEVDKRSFFPAIRAKLVEWAEYKAERSPYKTVKGLNMQLSQLENVIKKYGEKAVLARMDEAMRGEWVGWNFDTMDKSGSYGQYQKPQQHLDKPKSRYPELKSKSSKSYEEQCDTFQEEFKKAMEEAGFSLNRK